MTDPAYQRAIARAATVETPVVEPDPEVLRLVELIAKSVLEQSGLPPSPTGTYEFQLNANGKRIDLGKVAAAVLDGWKRP